MEHLVLEIQIITMKNKDNILKEIFENDPLGLLKVSPKKSATRTSDERLVSSFGDINEFIEKNEREPKPDPTNISEYKLYATLKGLRENQKKIEALKAEAIAIRTRLEGQNVDASLIEAVVADRLKKTMEPGMFAKLFGEKDPTMEQVKELPQFKAMLVDMIADSSFTASGSTVINQYVGGAVSGDTIVDSSKKETYSNYLTNFNGADGASGNLSVQGS